MGQHVSVPADFTAHKTNQDNAITLSDAGDTTVKNKFTVNGTTLFKDDVTLDTGKKINGYDIPTTLGMVSTLNTDLTTLKTTVGGLGAASSGDFSNKALTTTGSGNFGTVTASGLGTFGSIKTSSIDINGNVTNTGTLTSTGDISSTGLVKSKTGLNITDTWYGGISFGTSGRVLTSAMVAYGNNKLTSTGLDVNVVNSATIKNSGAITAASLSSTGDVSGGTLTTAGALSAGSVKATGSVTAASVSTTGAVSAASLTSSGDLTAGKVTSTGGLTIANKWVLDEFDDASVKGAKRLCVGITDPTANTTKYFACLNNQGNLIAYVPPAKV